MLIIAHRGNTNGPSCHENDPLHIEKALKKFDVEVDVWHTNDFYLGHYGPEYKIPLEWLIERKDKLWIHCKNLSALRRLLEHDLNIFYHESDSFTLTSKGFIWTYPGLPTTDRSVIVCHEPGKKFNCYGVCTDWPNSYL